jgi:serine/threonine protein kinase
VAASTYEQSERICTGARFSVVRARRAHGVGVVIKRPHGNRPELRSAERLRHECEVLTMLAFPGALRALDFATIDGQPALVLQDAGRRNLGDLIGGRPLGIDDFLTLAVRMAEIVREVHERSVIHQDICPDNFVVAVCRR